VGCHHPDIAKRKHQDPWGETREGGKTTPTGRKPLFWGHASEGLYTRTEKAKNPRKAVVKRTKDEAEHKASQTGMKNECLKNGGDRPKENKHRVALLFPQNK